MLTLRRAFTVSLLPSCNYDASLYVFRLFNRGERILSALVNTGEIKYGFKGVFHGDVNTSLKYYHNNWKKPNHLMGVNSL